MKQITSTYDCNFFVLPPFKFGKVKTQSMCVYVCVWYHIHTFFNIVSIFSLCSSFQLFITKILWDREIDGIWKVYRHKFVLY